MEWPPATDGDLVFVSGEGAITALSLSPPEGDDATGPAAGDRQGRER